jgi:hypothetical protein
MDSPLIIPQHNSDALRNFSSEDTLGFRLHSSFIVLSITKRSSHMVSRDNLVVKTCFYQIVILEGTVRISLETRSFILSLTCWCQLPGHHR